MKKNLLITTALVAVSFAVSNAWAEDATHKVTSKDGLTVSGTLDGLHAGNETDAQGGAVFHSGEGTLEVKSGTTFSNNYAQQTGGAISAYGDVNIGDNVTFSGNRSYLSEDESTRFKDHPEGRDTIATEMGSAIYMQGKHNLTIGEHATFSGNKSSSGVVFLYDGVNATIGDNVSFVDNEAGEKFSHAEKPVTGGGALNLSAASTKNEVSVGKNALFARNIADFGAAVFVNDDKNELTLGENATFTGNIARQAGGAISNGGTLNFGNNVTFDGNQTELTETGGGAAGAILNNGNLTFNGDSTFKNNQAKNGGALMNNNGTTTFKGDTVFNNNTATKQGGAIYNANEITFEGNAVFSNNTANGKLNDIYNANSSGKITVTDGASLTLDGGITGSEGTLTLEKGSTLSVNNETVIEGTTEVKNGTGEKANLKLRVAASDESKDFNLAEKINGFSSLKGNLAIDLNNNLYDIVETEEGVYTATQKSAATVASNLGVKVADAGTILGMMNASSENPGFQRVQSALADMAQDTNVNSEAVSRAADALGADGAPVVRTHATMLSNMIFDTADEALSDTLQNATVGQSSGDSVFEKAKIWVKGLFNYADKDDTSKAHGFDMDTYGAAMGVDKEVGNGKVGLGYAYSKSDIDGYTRDTDVKTHTAFVYGQYQPADWYVKGVAAYSWSDYKEKKSVLGENADSKYDVDTLALQGMFGYNFHVENDYDVTPEAGLRYLRASQDASTNALGVRVKARDIDVLTAVAGVKVAKNFALTDSLTIRPEVRAALTYDLDADNNDSIVTMGNTSYRVNGEKLERFGYELGAKLATDITSNWEVSAGYEGRFREDYSDHTGMLSAKYKF